MSYIFASQPIFLKKILPRGRQGLSCVGQIRPPEIALWAGSHVRVSACACVPAIFGVCADVISGAAETSPRATLCWFSTVRVREVSSGAACGLFKRPPRAASGP